jgi:hypothetical protein
LSAPTDEGVVNYEPYAAFNRTIAGGHSGNGVAQVIITLYPTP